MDARMQWLLDTYAVERREGPDEVRMGSGKIEPRLRVKVVRRDNGNVVASDSTANSSTFCSRYGSHRGPEASDLSIIDALTCDESVFGPDMADHRNDDGSWSRVPHG